MSLKTALAVRLAGERQIVAAFRAGRAVSLSAARPLHELGLNDSGPLRAMVTATIICRAGPARYFLDERVWAGRRQLSAATIVRALVVIGVVAAALAVYFYGR